MRFAALTQGQGDMLRRPEAMTLPRLMFPIANPKEADEERAQRGQAGGYYRYRGVGSCPDADG